MSEPGTATPDTAPAGYPTDVIADLFDLTPRRIQQLAKEGVIPKAMRGLYPLAGAVRGYIRYLKRVAAGGEDQAQLQIEKNRLVKARREQAELMLAKLRGELLDARAVERRAFDWSRAIRDAWLNWPAKVSAEMAAELGIADDLAMHAALERRIREHLLNLAELREPAEPAVPVLVPEAVAGNALEESALEA